DDRAAAGLHRRAAAPCGRIGRRRSRDPCRRVSGTVPFQPPQVAAYFSRALIAQLHILLQRLGNNLLQLEGHRRIQFDGWSRVAVKYALENNGGSVAFERNPPGGHFVEDGAQGEQIATPVEFFSASLLGRHIGDGAYRGAWHRQMRRRHRRRLASRGLHYRAPVIGQFGQPEVQDLRLSSRSDEDIRGLQVSMHNTFAVRDVESVGNLNTDIDDLVHRQRVAVDLLIQTLAFQQLHGDEVLRIAFLDGIDGANVGMVQGRGGTRLLLETLQSVLIFLDVPGEKLQRYLAAKPGVFRLVHHAHTAGAQLSHDFVMQDALPDQDIQG